CARRGGCSTRRESMQLYLIRHADAVEHPDDAARQLSPRGRDQAKALGQFLGRGGAFTPAEIWHSPLRRARETAELLAAAAKLAVPLREKAGLRPEDNPAALVPMIQRTTASVALVGHEPHLSALASLLV